MKRDEDQLLEALLRRAGEDFRNSYPREAAVNEALRAAARVTPPESLWERCSKWFVFPNPVPAFGLGFAAVVILAAGVVMRQTASETGGAYQMQLAAVSQSERELFSFGDEMLGTNESYRDAEQVAADGLSEEEEVLLTYEEFRQEFAQVIDEHYSSLEDDEEYFDLAPEYIPLVIG